MISIKHLKGFTLIEIILVIVITAILANTILLATTTATKNTPAILNNTLATLTAQRCMEWFIGQARISGYAAITSPSAAVPAFCTAPTGYAPTVNVQALTISGDNTFKQITVTSANVSLVTFVGMY